MISVPLLDTRRCIAVQRTACVLRLGALSTRMSPPSLRRSSASTDFSHRSFEGQIACGQSLIRRGDIHVCSRLAEKPSSDGSEMEGKRARNQPRVLYEAHQMSADQASWLSSRCPQNLICKALLLEGNLRTIQSAIRWASKSHFATTNRRIRDTYIGPYLAPCVVRSFTPRLCRMQSFRTERKRRSPVRRWR
ncbi:hypothetical protein K505DRAFT_149653 [Melanomma pulvis-pyrius CBS 109.77]|uniref:Uncharacterized protein n=1 Tax=Melanomma pulvis-pyrius CBS 109.77 TaxID=1314802 RepID=A0A6A6WQ65_9PLEO|nr:hypothetical protein K505DRAFT_149653 [Melanomma pulvis-pyrius CBS 109.77]